MLRTTSGLLVGLILLSGCASTPEPVSTKKFSVHTQPTREAQFSTPTVRQNGSILEVSGTVRLAGPLNDDGRHIHVDLASADGEPLDLIEADLKPNPDNPNDLHSAAYSVNYFFTPPPGTVVIVSLAEAQCWIASAGGNEKAGALVDYNQAGAKAKTIGSKAGKSDYRETNRAAKQRGFRSPGYPRRSSSSRRR